MEQEYEKAVAFHGHSCPGLAMGYRMSRAALDFLSDTRSADEEVVAIVENDACGVDALQWLTGCTFGKGNLKFKDYGKQVYTLYSRESHKGVRALLNIRNVPETARQDRKSFINWLLSAPDEDIVTLSEVNIDEPEPARIVNTVICGFCGEAVMDTRTRDVNGKIACIPCAEKYGAAQ